MPGENWFLSYSDPTGAGPADLVGLPWGSGTEYARRVTTGAAQPFDAGCQVEPILGGFWAMSAIRDSLVACLTAARTAKKPPGQNGLVYIAGWRLNPLRDLSVQNSWRTSSWWDASGRAPVQADKSDETVLGLLLKLIDAGVLVRVMVWMPTWAADKADPAHSRDHVFLARAVDVANGIAKRRLGTTRDIGVVCLDARVADQVMVVATHHQKMCVIRTADDAVPPVAYVGGVDLAFTRRDAPKDPATATQPPTGWYDGDWESGTSVGPENGQTPAGIPRLQDAWPFGDGSLDHEYVTAVGALVRPTEKKESDLDVPVYGESAQKWHDQHLRLHGPVVSTVQQQFCERWVDDGWVGEVSRSPAPCQQAIEQGQAVFSTKAAYSAKDDVRMGGNVIVPLDPVDPVGPVAGATSKVQLWRTIPARPRGGSGLFVHGEYTVLAGYARAMAAAQKLVFITDQYFWSIPTARLLNDHVTRNGDLGVVIVLPPHADGSNAWYLSLANAQHKARANAFEALADGLTDDQLRQIVVLNAWDSAVGQNRGVYVHAKSHVYDGQLLVCGSANINRRSLTGDSEIALAVSDPAVATQHLRNVVGLLTGGAAWPEVSGSGAYDPARDPGTTLVENLRAHPPRNATFDPQWDHLGDTDWRLPNGVLRSTTQLPGAFGTVYNHVMESCSLENGAIERGRSTLADVTRAVERTARFERIGRSPGLAVRADESDLAEVPG
ncbi:phospholipase D-like domain-containing protein [Cellulomonas alba]|uniref:Phospholipase D-like domain-containing protein n=1 Tax=Cellulomonas alba TaxID=3053467 RepID=A0ABT7SCG4_9CELL|nr:phospholipase D-like domain-containing protein [Cellulomonas alba]MDM7853881.1 phospholipase D-like domain-containing protein [Cellulomonas alba]